jgi:excisionase family DNA binding protein
VVTDLDLLTIYLGATIKQREAQFADTARTAEIAGLSRRTIQLWIDTGVLQALRIGKNYRVSLDSLRIYLEGQIDK